MFLALDRARRCDALCFAVAVRLMHHSGQVGSFVTTFAYGACTISQILNPLLPVALVAGQSVAAAQNDAKRRLGAAVLRLRQMKLHLGYAGWKAAAAELYCVALLVAAGVGEASQPGASCSAHSATSAPDVAPQPACRN